MLMENKYLVTLAIATYNAKKHIDPLFKSLQKIWNNKDIKILFIDDGSVDKTVEYLRLKTANYSNVQIHVEKKNMGLAFIRQKAIQLLETKWIWNMDCDDNLINTDKIPELIKVIKHTKSNVITFKYILKDERGNEAIPNWFHNMDKRDLLIDYSINDRNKMPFVGYAWNKIINVSILKSIVWYKTYNEDTHFSGALHALASFTLYNEFLYSYNTRYLSISRRPNYPELVNKSTLSFLDFIMENKVENYQIYIITSIFLLSTRCYLLEKDQMKKLVKLFIKYRNSNLLKWFFHQDTKHKIFYILFKMRLFFLAKLILIYRNRNTE